MSFSPLDLANLLVWFKGNTGVTQAAGEATAWADQSGNSHNLILSNPNYPLTYVPSAVNSLPAIRSKLTTFSGSPSYGALTTPGNIPAMAGGTIFVVLKRHSGNNAISGGFTTAVISALNFSMGLLAPANADAIYGEATSSSDRVFTPNIQETWYTVRLRFTPAVPGVSNGSLAIASNNGTEDVGQTYDATGNWPLYLFGDGDFSIAEVVGVNENLTGNDSLEVEYFLNKKYNHYTWTFGLPLSEQGTPSIITFPPIPDKNVGDPDFNPGATSTSPAPITYTSDDLSIAEIVNGKVHIVSDGTCNITAHQATITGYRPATNVTRTLTITTPIVMPPTVTTKTISGFIDSNDNILFEAKPKFPGADYNNIIVYALPATNGKAGYFDIRVVHVLEPELNESYPNLNITGRPTVNESTYLNKISKDSQLIDITYHDLSAIAGSGILTPLPVGLKLKDGTDGSAAGAADYIGDSAIKSGVYAFDGVSDIMQLAILDDVSALSGVREALASYADARKDLQSFIHLSESSESDLSAERAGLNINTPYNMFFAGGVQVVDTSGAIKAIPEIGDILGIAAFSEAQVGAWWSFAGPNRGILTNCIGADNKFGASGNKLNLDLLASRQINVVINRNNKTMLWGGFTSQVLESQMSFANIVRLNIYLKKALGPVLENFLEEPNDLITWKKIYLTVKPFLDGLVEKRAMYDYRWEGDQFAKSIDELVINDASQVGLGKYKAKLFCKDIVAMQEFTIDINLSPSGVSFEDASIISQ